MKNNSSQHYITSFRKLLIYFVIILHVTFYYLVRIKKYQWSLGDYFIFLRRALRLLLVFRHNKIVKVFNGYKLHLYLPAYPSKAFFSAVESKLCRLPPRPVTIVFSITKACGYKCQHCYQRLDQAQELDEKTMLDVARAMQDLGVSMFDIEGGEPFLRYERLLHLVTALDERAEIWINTTGAEVTRDKLLELKNKGLFGLMISIHSPEAKKHDAFTGISDSFTVACNALRLCRVLGLVSAINSVLSEEEIAAGRLVDLMLLAKDLGCDYVQLIHPKPSGKWLGHTECMQRGCTLLNQIKDYHRFYNSAKASSFPALSAQVFEEDEAVLGCTAGGIDRFYLNANGELQPCEFLNISFGNVKDEGFDKVYERMRSSFSTPGCDWLCCTQSAEIYRLFKQHQLQQTPLPWNITKILINKWQCGKPTPIYKKLGIYK
jgi:MoaA/NifB/PqqE/SkfB family radical SAM enzyme